MSCLCNVRRKSTIIAAIHLVAAVVIGDSVATTSAQETARPPVVADGASQVVRSEERRVGKECRL